MPTNFGTGFGPSIGMSGWNNQQLGGRQQLQKPTKQQKFPGLDADQIKRLESLTSDPQEQQKLYQQAIALKSQKDMDENRIATENEITYRSMSEKDIKQKNYMQSNVRLEQLADLTKKKFGLNADADTQGVINGLMQYAQDKGVSMDSLNDYLAGYNERFLYDTGLKEESTAHKVGQAGTDIAGGAYDSVTSLFRWGGKGLANAIGWTAKQLGADEAKTDELVQSYKDYIDSNWSAKSIGADTESLTYDISKGVGDMAQVLAGEGLLKAGVQSTAKGAELMKYLEKAPTWQKMVAGGLEGAGDMALFSIVSENKLPTTTEEAIGAGLGAVIPGAGALYKASKPIVKKALNKTASQLELSGLLNPAKLNQIKDQLIKEGTDLAEAGLKGGNAEDVGTWMIERGFKGDKPTLISDLGTHAEKSHKLKREILGASDTLHDVESAKKSLQVIHDTIKDVPGLEEKLARVEELMAKDKHTLSELDEIKSILDDTKSIYTLAGDAKAGAVNKGLDKVRKDLRKYIEDEATKEGLGNVKLLNNETQIAKGLQDAISRKDSADMAREMLGVFSKTAIGGAAGYNVGPFDNNTLGGKVGNVIIGALAGKYLFSTKAKTSLASYINKMSGGSKKELERLIAGDISVKKLSKKTQNELAKAFEESGIMEAGVPTEMTQAEYEALLKNYSKSDLPALEFKEGVDDAGKNILAGDSEKIIATPEGVNFREGQIGELPTKNINYIKQTLKDVGLSDEQVEKVIKEIEAKNAKQEGLFGAVDKGIESEGLNHEILSTKDLRKMEDLDNVTSALKREDKADYISHRIAEDKGVNYLGTDDEMDMFANIAGDVENLIADFEYGGNEAAKIRADHLFPGETAESIINKYTQAYEKDLKAYKDLVKKYEGYEKGNVKLNKKTGKGNNKSEQLKIIQETNPAKDDIHTWIRSESDIKTYQEAIDEYGAIEDLTPDFTKDMVQKALDEGEITVYSSYPIKNGYWVTPSKMEAQAYAGGGKIYSKKVKLGDVAWVDELQGQLAKK